MRYLLIYTMKYEDNGLVYSNSLPALKEWIQTNRSEYNFNYDNIVIYELKEEIDIYELMRNTHE